jgi:hypothetical protein
MVEFTDEERRWMILALRQAIEGYAKYPLSDRMKAWRSTLAKLEGRDLDEKPPPLPELPPRQWPPPPRRKRR